MTTYAANTTITNGGYQTTNTGTVTITGAGNGYLVGGAGTVLTTPNGASSGWINTSAVTGSITAPSSNFHNGNGTPIMTIPYSENKVIIDEKAALEVKGSIVLNGESLNERIERIETLLNIPTRDITMEDKYPKLKKLWEEYNRELAKYKTWDALKDE